MSDLAQMELGQAVDYVIEYNDLHEAGTRKGEAPEKEQPSVRKATQADWDAFWG